MQVNGKQPSVNPRAAQPAPRQASNKRNNPETNRAVPKPAGPTVSDPKSAGANPKSSPKESADVSHPGSVTRTSSKAPSVSLPPVPRRAAVRGSVHQEPSGQHAGTGEGHADSKRVDKAYRALERKANPYYSTLADPWNVGGVRIPDSVNYPSATFSITRRLTATVAASGTAGIAIGWASDGTASGNIGHILPVPYSEGSGSKSFVVGQTSQDGADDSNIWITSGPSQFDASCITLQQWSDSSALSVPGLFQQVRLVSAGIAVNSTAALLANRGVWRAAFAPPDYYLTRDSSFGVGISFDEIGQLPDSIEVPVSKNTGVSVTYSPLDLSKLNFIEMVPAGADSAVYRQADYGIMFAALSGAEPGTTIIGTLVLNFEGVPRSNAMSLVQTEPSFDDPIMIASAMNRREEDDWAKSGTSEADRAQHDWHPNHIAAKVDEKIVHHQLMSVTKRVGKNKGSGSGGSILTERKEQVPFLETMFKSLIPLVEGGISALMKVF